MDDSPYQRKFTRSNFVHPIVVHLIIDHLIIDPTYRQSQHSTFVIPYPNIGLIMNLVSVSLGRSDLTSPYILWQLKDGPLGVGGSQQMAIWEGINRLAVTETA
jgi:hypothetical protein